MHARAHRRLFKTSHGDGGPVLFSHAFLTEHVTATVAAWRQRNSFTQLDARTAVLSGSDIVPSEDFVANWMEISYQNMSEALHTLRSCCLHVLLPRIEGAGLRLSNAVYRAAEWLSCRAHSPECLA